MVVDNREFDHAGCGSWVGTQGDWQSDNVKGHHIITRNAPLSIKMQPTLTFDLNRDHKSVAVGSERSITINLDECYGVVVPFEHFPEALTHMEDLV